MQPRPVRIDLHSETVMGLGEAARRMPSAREGKPVNPSPLWRWIHAGVKTSSGQVVRLDALRLGGRWVPSLEALQRFADAQTPDLGEADTRPTPRTPTARQRAS